MVMIIVGMLEHHKHKNMFSHCEAFYRVFQCFIWWYAISSKIRWYLTKVDKYGRIPLRKFVRDAIGLEPYQYVYVAVELTGKTEMEDLAPYKESAVK